MACVVSPVLRHLTLIRYAGNTPVQYELRPDKGKLAKVARDVVKGAVYLGELAGKSVSTFLGYPDGADVLSSSPRTEVEIPSGDRQNDCAGSV